jgi:uncharacterized protein YeaO (DUF488 family)
MHALAGLGPCLKGASLKKIQIKRIYEPPGASDPEKWPEFRARYIAEMKHNPAVVELQDIAPKSKTITLLFAA